MAATLATQEFILKKKSSFGSSVVPVQTAIPAFVGYTEKQVEVKRFDQHTY